MTGGTQARLLCRTLCVICGVANVRRRCWVPRTCGPPRLPGQQFFGDGINRAQCCRAAASAAAAAASAIVAPAAAATTADGEQSARQHCGSLSSAGRVAGALRSPRRPCNRRCCPASPPLALQELVKGPLADKKAFLQVSAHAAASGWLQGVSALTHAGLRPTGRPCGRVDWAGGGGHFGGDTGSRCLLGRTSLSERCGAEGLLCARGRCCVILRTNSRCASTPPTPGQRTPQISLASIANS